MRISAVNVECGIDGVIIPDLPFRDYQEHYRIIAERYNIRVIMLITPETSEERVREIDTHTDGFIYMVSSAATTGAQQDFNEQKRAYFKKDRRYAPEQSVDGRDLASPIKRHSKQLVNTLPELSSAVSFVTLLEEKRPGKKGDYQTERSPEVRASDENLRIRPQGYFRKPWGYFCKPWGGCTSPVGRAETSREFEQKQDVD